MTTLYLLYMQSYDEELFIWKPTGKDAETESVPGENIENSDTSEPMV